MGQALRGLQTTAATFSVLLGGTLVALAVFFVATVMLVRLRAYVAGPPPGPQMISVDRPPPSPAAVSERPTLSPDQHRMVEEKARARPAAPTPPAAADPAQTAVVLALAVLFGTTTLVAWLPLARLAASRAQVSTRVSTAAAAPVTPHGRLLGWGIGVMILGPAAFWSVRLWLLALQPRAPQFATPQLLGVVLPFGGVALFALGWLLAGAARRPGRRAWQGLPLAAALYVLTGVAVLMSLGAATGTPLPTTLWALLTMNGAGFVLLWPLLVVQLLGLLGFSFG